MHRTAIDWLTSAVLQAEARGEAIGPAALTLLLRRYTTTGRDDIRAALERGLTCGLARHAPAPEARTPQGRLPEGPNGGDSAAADWLLLFAEASTVADDDRIGEAVALGAGALRGAWPSRGSVASAMRSVTACLAASQVLQQDAHALVPAAIDELERVVCRVYRPGEALARSLAQPDEADGALEDHVAAAAALITAYAVTGRLPYAMLAEELTQYALRQPSTDFAARCEAARVLSRLALLHDDEDYRAAAVAARAADYRGEARRLLEALSSSYREQGTRAAIYAVALDEWLAAT